MLLNNGRNVDVVPLENDHKHFLEYMDLIVADNGKLFIVPDDLLHITTSEGSFSVVR